jgi:hypothetical protein
MVTSWAQALEVCLMMDLMITLHLVEDLIFYTVIINLLLLNKYILYVEDFVNVSVEY